MQVSKINNQPVISKKYSSNKSNQPAFGMQLSVEKDVVENVISNVKALEVPKGFVINPYSYIGTFLRNHIADLQKQADIFSQSSKGLYSDDVLKINDILISYKDVPIATSKMKISPEESSAIFESAKTFSLSYPSIGVKLLAKDEKTGLQVEQTLQSEDIQDDLFNLEILAIEAKLP